MEFRKTMNEVCNKYKYWRAPRCEVCELKFVDQGEYRPIYRGNPTDYPTQEIEISITEKGFLRFKQIALAFGSGIYWTIRDSSWCKDDAPSPESLLERWRKRR